MCLLSRLLVIVLYVVLINHSKRAESVKNTPTAPHRVRMKTAVCMTRQNKMCPSWLGS